MYLAVNKRFHWIATVPATFMTAVSITYILVAPEGFKLASSIAYPVGLAAAVGALALFLVTANKKALTPKIDHQVKA
jgi:ABC-type transport system involved in cytochrome c biogenesis permease subunit